MDGQDRFVSKPVGSFSVSGAQMKVVVTRYVFCWTAGQLRHPVTGRFLAGDCERDCQERCAGFCGAQP